jgi:hypothetical protein
MELPEKQVNLYHPHAKQKKIIENDARFKVVVCGRRFGKTTFAVNELLYHFLRAEDSKYPYWYIAPTYRQAKEIIWEYLKHQIKDLPKSIQYNIKINESELSISHADGGRLALKGADKEDSLRGPGLNGVVLDEYAFMKPMVWQNIIRPMLTDTKGWAIFIGTPNGYNHFFDLYNKVKERPDIYSPKEWTRFHFSSYGNPHLAKDELEKAKLELTEDTFAQEYMAEFKRFAGLVYKEFDRDVHVRNIDQPDPEWVCYRSIDFGQVNPTAVLFIGVDKRDNIYIYDEIYQKNLYTSELARLINAKSGSYYARTFGDSSAAQSIKDLSEYGIHVTPVAKETGSRVEDWIKVGIEKIRERLRVREGTGQPKLFVSSHCIHTIREFESYRWQEKRAQDDINKPEKPEKSDDHAMDALRYFVCEINKPQPEITLPEPGMTYGTMGY